MKDQTTSSLSEFLDAIATRSPTPGGGAVAAAAGALSCAMAQMVTAYSVKKNSPDDVRSKCETARERLGRADGLFRALIMQDAQAYENMTKLGKERRDGEATTQTAYHDAVLRAISVPMEMAALAADALDTLDEFKESANRYLVSDLGVAAVLANATAEAAGYSVRINLMELTDAGLKNRITHDLGETLARCRRRDESIRSFVRNCLE
jgi:formiminotetrahydrofolate cyclodeaminase